VDFAVLQFGVGFFAPAAVGRGCTRVFQEVAVPEAGGAPGLAFDVVQALQRFDAEEGDGVAGGNQQRGYAVFLVFGGEFGDVGVDAAQGLHLGVAAGACHEAFEQLVQRQLLQAVFGDGDDEVGFVVGDSL